MKILQCTYIERIAEKLAKAQVVKCLIFFHIEYHYIIKMRLKRLTIYLRRRSEALNPGRPNCPRGMTIRAFPLAGLEPP